MTSHPILALLTLACVSLSAHADDSLRRFKINHETSASSGVGLNDNVKIPPYTVLQQLPACDADHGALPYLAYINGTPKKVYFQPGPFPHPPTETELQNRQRQIDLSQKPTGQGGERPKCQYKLYRSTVDTEIVDVKVPNDPGPKPIHGYDPAPDRPPVVSGSLLDRLRSATHDLDRRLVDRFLHAIAEVNRSDQIDAIADIRNLENAYRGQTPEQTRESMIRAQQELAARESEIANDKTLSPDERGRYQDILQTANDKAAQIVSGIDTLPIGAPVSTLAQSSDPLEAALGRQDLDPTLLKDPSRGLASVSGGSPASSSFDSLINRLVLYYGLNPLKRKQLAAAKSDKEDAAALLHNGDPLSRVKLDKDCPSFMSQAFTLEMRKEKLTTLDFYAIWHLARGERIPASIHEPAEREKKLKELAKGFTAIDVSAGEDLEPSDLLVYRILWETSGHVFVVKEYDPDTLNAFVMEESQTAGAIQERDFNLSAAPLEWPDRQPRPGLYALRLKKSPKNPVCDFTADPPLRVKQKNLEKLRIPHQNKEA